MKESKFNNKTEILFFSEMFFNCKAYCSGCNVNKISNDTITYNSKDLKTINNRIIEYINEKNSNEKNDFYPTLIFGPGDFLSLSYEKIEELLNCFDKNIKFFLAGNLSLIDEKDKIIKIINYGLKNDKEIHFQLVFNPLLKEKHANILKKNLFYIEDNQGEFNTVLNMSDIIYKSLTPLDYLNKLKEFNIKFLAIISSPNDILISKKMFQTSLEKETKWLLELFDLWIDNPKYKEIDLDVFEIRFLFFEKINLYNKDMNYLKKTVENYYKKIFYIDKNLDIRMSCENIGDYHYIKESNFKPLGNLNDKNIYSLISSKEFKKNINKQILGILYDDICKDCEFQIFCMRTPVFWQKQKYSKYKGKETNEFCYGLKQINKKILENLEKKRKNYDKI